MHGSARTASARSSGGGSRRRRWEMKSKESFERSLAMEVHSPPRRDSGFRRKYKRDSSSDYPEDRNPFFEADESKSPPCYSRDSPPRKSRHKSAPAHHEGESDLLSVKLSALIEEASTKSKDSGKTPQGSVISTKNQIEHTTESGPLETQEERENLMETRSLKDWDKAQIINDKFETKSLNIARDSPRMEMDKGKKEEDEESHDYRPSAPPLSSPESSRRYPTKNKKVQRKCPASRMLMGNNADKESFITVQLREMEEDVIGGASGGQCILSAPSLLLNTTINPSGTISTVYQEKLGGFIIARNEMEGMRRKKEDLHDSSLIPTPGSHAIFLQSGFRTFSVLCQGLLAGITLAHCLVIFLLESDCGSLPGIYPPTVTHVFFALILFLTTLCLVAAFDRCDFVGAGVFSGHGIKMPWSPALYIASLILSLVAVRAENVLINFNSFVTQMVSKEKALELVEWWQWICVVRTSLAVLAWLAVVADPHTDALLDALQHTQHK